MLSGLNGSGKSAIFDARDLCPVRPSPRRRPARRRADQQGQRGLSVEFDFLLDGRTYRAKRTLASETPRGGARHAADVALRPGDDGRRLGPVEGTGQKREFDAWVADNIGLNYDTFTSSVLLLQGKAEKLLDSKPEGRREVLAGIVDLDRYQQLHQKADEQRKKLKADVDSISNQLDALLASSLWSLPTRRNAFAWPEGTQCSPHPRN